MATALRTAVMMIRIIVPINIDTPVRYDGCLILKNEKFSHRRLPAASRSG